MSGPANNMVHLHLWRGIVSSHYTASVTLRNTKHKPSRESGGMPPGKL